MNLICAIRGYKSLANDSALACFEELNNLGDIFGVRQFFLHRFDCLAAVVFRTINQAKGLFNELHSFWRVIFSFQTNQIDPANLSGIAVGDHEWRNVLHNFRATAGNGEPTDPTKLMYRCEAAHYCVVSDLNMAGQGAVVRKNDVVANGAIVSDMAGEEKFPGVPALFFPVPAVVGLGVTNPEKIFSAAFSKKGGHPRNFSR